MEKKIPSWKTLFQITEVLELAALRKDARSHTRLYGSLTFSQSRVCVALIRLLEKQPSGVSLKELAADFHAFYNAERVLVDDDSERNARLALCLAARRVLANGLEVLGVSAPERM